MMIGTPAQAGLMDPKIMMELPMIVLEDEGVQDILLDTFVTVTEMALLVAPMYCWLPFHIALSL
jgi:hypothetical protein